MNKKFDVIMPVVAEDVGILTHFFNKLVEYLPMRKIVLIGNDKLRERLQTIDNKAICYLNEDKLIRYEEVRDIIAGRTDGDMASIARTGWYLQQFLKMQYSFICEDEYYLVWDSDTVPLKRVEVFENGQPVFHLKTEIHEAYFKTMGTILPDISKQINHSFISEHMLINCEKMKEMIGQIEANLNLAGKSFYEKILNAVELTELEKSGFSEYETYGSYCTARYPDMYLLRNWRSLRGGNKYFDNKDFGDCEMKWLAASYDAVSFEKTVNKMYGYSVFHVRGVQRLFSFGVMRIIMNMYHVLVRGGKRCVKILCGSWRGKDRGIRR
jgi:hypothetical protein